MKPATHPIVTITGIIASLVINAVGSILLDATGHAGLLFAGVAISFAVWVDIVIDHNRRVPSFLPDDTEQAVSESSSAGKITP